MEFGINLIYCCRNKVYIFTNKYNANVNTALQLKEAEQ
jgi:hypothetical protein